jgi:hypothetical protein
MRLPDRSSGSASPRFTRHKRTRAVDWVNSFLGWSPVKSDLHTIVQTAWEWHQNRPLSPIAVLPARKTRDQAAAIH